MSSELVLCVGALAAFGASTVLTSVVLIGVLEQRILRAGFDRSQMVNICYSMGATLVAVAMGGLVFLLI